MSRSSSSALGGLMIALFPAALAGQSAARPAPRSVEHILPVAATVAAPAAAPAAGGVVTLERPAAPAPDAPVVAPAAASAGSAGGAGAADASLAGAESTPSAPAPSASGAGAVIAPSVAREVFGVSGALRAAVLRPSQPLSASLLAVTGVPDGEAPHWVPLHGTVRGGMLGEPVFSGQVTAPESPGVWSLARAGGEYASAPRTVSLITTMPFDQKRDGYLNGYHIGRYPTEGTVADGVYAPPEGFIEVTAENRDVQLSEHFRLRQFLTKDQFDVWPKYLALNLRLIDKLELVLQELNAMGVRALSLHVMSGFRTPQYNGPGGDGRATLSRHMYGDAADIWVDGDNDGYIDDLNGDGRHDIRDAAVLLRAVERVEQKYPELTGGAGLYESNDSHGPYVHVDVRGSRARW